MKKVRLFAHITPETYIKLKEMITTADRINPQTHHSFGDIIEILLKDIKPPIERQREKTRELWVQFQKEKDILEDMEKANGK
jgi:hypothetical protein